MDSRKRPLRNAQELKELGAKIRKLRKERGISQEDLAHEAGIERSYMGAIERGERNPSYDKLVSVARALGNSASNLF